MNTTTSKLLRGLVIVVVLVFVISKVYNSFKGNYETEETVLYSVNENIVFDGVFVRNETVLTQKVDGVIDYVYADGSKLSNLSVIANVYENEQQIYAKNKIEKLKKELSNLEHAQNPGTTNYAKPETIKNQIDEKYLLLASAIESQNMDDVANYKSELNSLMNLYNIVTQAETDYNDRKTELEEEIERYQKQYALPKTVITTDTTGYFVSTTDGYEALLNKENVGSITIDTINNIIDGKDATKTENAIGKLLDSYECKIVGVIDATNKFLKGDSLKIRFGNSDQTYDVSVDQIIKETDEKWIVILDCDAINEKLTNERVEKIELIFNEYSGLKVPREAIKFKEFEETVTDENGLEVKQKVKYKGVYIKLGQEISFKKIDVIYEGDNFVISKNVSDTEYLNLYDQIVLEEVKSSDI